MTSIAESPAPTAQRPARRTPKTNNRYTLQRGWMNLPAFGADRYSRRCAWLWLVERAAALDMTIAGPDGVPVQLRQGELAVSYDDLAREWRWRGPEDAEQFLLRLCRFRMVCLHNDGPIPIVQIIGFGQFDQWRLA